MSSVGFTAEQFAEARRALGLPPDAPERVVEAAVILDLGAADDLIADVDRVLTTELEFLTDGARLGFVHTHWQIDDVPPPESD
jgi:hypothetical protein